MNGIFSSLSNLSMMEADRLGSMWVSFVVKEKQKSAVRRVPRDPDLTKRLILDAAEMEFALYGLKGARTDQTLYFVLPQVADAPTLT